MLKHVTCLHHLRGIKCIIWKQASLTQGKIITTEDALEEEMATTPVFLPGRSHGQRSLVGYSPQGCKSCTWVETKPLPPPKPAAAKSLQSCPTLCDPIDGSPPGSPAPGILQARTLEWVAISFSNAWKWKVKVKSLSHVQLLATPWTAAYQTPLSTGFSRQECCSGVPLPSHHQNLHARKESCMVYWQHFTLLLPFFMGLSILWIVYFHCFWCVNILFLRC